MTVVYVEKAGPSSRYKWSVYRGRVRVSDHYKKANARQAAFDHGREHNAIVKEQLTDGTWRTIRNY